MWVTSGKIQNSSHTLESSLKHQPAFFFFLSMHVYLANISLISHLSLCQERSSVLAWSLHCLVTCVIKSRKLALTSVVGFRDKPEMIELQYHCLSSQARMIRGESTSLEITTDQQGWGGLKEWICGKMEDRQPGGV